MGRDRMYRLNEGILLDWSLFVRLRARGESRGPAGTTDLRAALGLVRGVPLEGGDLPSSNKARNPYTWLPGSEFQPEHLVAAIVDTAHRLVSLALPQDDTATARWAVGQAWIADPDRSEDTPWRDLIQVADVDGNEAELDQLFDELLRIRDVEVAEELSPATYGKLLEVVPHRLGVMPRRSASATHAAG